METSLVRLKPYDPKRGHVLRRYTYRGIRFVVERGWYRVSAAMAEHLEGVRQNPNNPQSPPAFDVVTEEEAQRLDAEAAKAERPTLASDAIPLSVGREGDGDGAERDDEPVKRDGRGKRPKAAPAPTE